MQIKILNVPEEFNEIYSETKEFKNYSFQVNSKGDIPEIYTKEIIELFKETNIYNNEFVKDSKEVLLFGEGSLVIDCNSLYESNRETFSKKVTLLLFLFGTPFRIFDRWPLWKPIGTNLDIEPIRATGIGYNPFHIDLVNTTCPPKYSVLLCERPDPKGGGESIISNLRAAVSELDRKDIEILSKPIYHDGKFFNLNGVGKEYNPFPVIDGLPSDIGFIRFTAKMHSELKESNPGKKALIRLEEKLIKNQRKRLVGKNQLLICNQHISAHGRFKLGPNQNEVSEERKRQLYQIFIK